MTAEISHRTPAAFSGNQQAAARRPITSAAASAAPPAATSSPPWNESNHRLGCFATPNHGLTLFRLGHYLTMLAKVCSAAVNGIDAYPVEGERVGPTILQLLFSPHY
jgi:hypothetical protein